MPIALEPAYRALFTALPGLATDPTPGPFVTRSRRLKHWNDVPPSEQPGLFQNQLPVVVTYAGDSPASKWVLKADLYVYAWHATVEDAQADGGSLINGLVDQVIAELDPDDPLQLNTLGGAVYWARVHGQIETDEGKLGQQTMAIIPVELIAAD